MGGHPLHPYPSPEELEERTRALARYPGTDILEYGTSVEGRPLLAAVQQGDPSKKSILVAGNIHGLEFVSALVALTFAERVFADPGLIQREEARTIFCIPTLNPDGYAQTWSREGRGSLQELRTNARGVDLNRNFPIPAPYLPSRMPGAGSTRYGTSSYRGSTPLSEPETRALSELVSTHGCHTSVSCHSFMGRFVPPNTKRAADHRNYKRICRAAASVQPRARYGLLTSRWFDVFTGELEDYLHHSHKTWAVCFESFPVTASFRQHLRAPTLFWRFNPREPQPWIDNDIPAIVELCRQSLKLSTPGPP